MSASSVNTYHCDALNAVWKGGGCTLRYSASQAVSHDREVLPAEGVGGEDDVGDVVDDVVRLCTVALAVPAKVYAHTADGSAAAVRGWACYQTQRQGSGWETAMGRDEGAT